MTSVFSPTVPTTNFNSHPHIEDDLDVLLSHSNTSYFNSHPHIEDDRAAKEELKTLQDFNSHPHIEDDSLNSEPRTNIHISIHILI